MRRLFNLGLVLLGCFLINATLVPKARADTEILVKYFDLTEGRLAFTYTVDDKKSIYVLDFATLEAEPLFKDGGTTSAPRYSPDGSKILFVGDKDGEQKIYLANSDGSGIKQLTSGPGADDEPDWSRDGKRVAFSSTRGGAGPEIYVMNADGSDIVALTKSGKQNVRPRWSPTEDLLLFTTNEYWPGSDLLQYSETTKKVSILTTGYVSSTQPAWSKTGQSFAFVYGPVEDTDIWLRSRIKEKGTPLITRPGKDIGPEFLEDGKRMYYLSEIEPGSGHYEIFLHDPKLGNAEPMQITESEGNIRDLSWTPGSLVSKASKAKAASPTLMPTVVLAATDEPKASEPSPSPTQ